MEKRSAPVQLLIPKYGQQPFAILVFQHAKSIYDTTAVYLAFIAYQLKRVVFFNLFVFPISKENALIKCTLPFYVIMFGNKDRAF